MILSFSFFLLGIIIGSFLNVLVCRLHEEETLLGRSFCRVCKHQIRWYDNIPLVSFIFLKGKCRDCKGGISWQYPILEFFSGVFFLLVGKYFFSFEENFSWGETSWLLFVGSIFLVIAAYDMRHMEIPLVLLLIAFIATGIFLIFCLLFTTESFFVSRLWQSLLGGTIVASFFFFLVFVSRETWMGWGDVWLGMVGGMVVGLPLALPMLTLSFGSGALVGIFALLYKKKDLRSQIPFAPFLVFGILSVLFLARAFPFFFDFFFPYFLVE
ncbi:MAG: prepilin peptidase [Candidatus Moranbacteria bacterium]|nr:prepilin peptidase [Candidatus Moranbacteria bacterium]